MPRQTGYEFPAFGAKEAASAANSEIEGGSSGALLTAAQVAELLGVPRTWVYAQSRSGRIPTVTLGRYRRYRREAIEAWLEMLEAEGINGGSRPRGA